MSAAKKSGMIAAFRADRLGARLISLVNTMRLAQKFGVDYRMHWIETTGVGSEFNDINALFDAGFTDDLLMPRQQWLKFRQQSQPVGAISGKTSQQVAQYLADGGDIRVELAFGLVSLKDEDPAEVARALREIFLNLPFAAALKPMIEAVQPALKNAVAYHMRRGDLVSNVKAMNKSWPHKFVPEAYYHAHMARALDQKQTVVVFSDEAETLAAAKAAFPAVKTVDDLVPMDGLSQGARDFFELYAMSACAKIIAPEASAFSATAADLGGTQRQDVKTDLPADVRNAVSEQLFQTLRDDPQALGEVGTIGQTLPHARGYLTANGRMDDAIALYDGFVARRMPISFIYPEFMDMLLQAGQHDRLLALAGQLDELPLQDTKSRQRCLGYIMAGQVAAGDAAACRSTIVSYFAQFPMSGDLKKTVPALLVTGVLTPDILLPYSPEIVFGFGRRVSLAGQSKPGREICQLLVPDTATALTDKTRATAEPLWWDWAPFLPANPVAVSARNGDLDEVYAALAKQDFASLSPDASSTFALLMAHRGETKQALNVMLKIGAAGTDNALVQHRLSYVFYLEKNWRAAADHAIAAADLSTAPAHQAWAGLMLMRHRKQADLARRYLTDALDAGSPFSTVAFNLAELERRAGRLSAAIAALKTAIRLNPADVRSRSALGELYADAGENDLAHGVFAQLHYETKLPMKYYPKYAQLLLDMDNKTSAREVVAYGLSQRPEMEALQTLQAAL